MDSINRASILLGRRWRNQRAASSMNRQSNKTPSTSQNQQQQQQQQPTIDQPHATGSAMTSKQQQNTSLSRQTIGSAPTSLRGPSTTTDPMSQSIGLQMHHMRPTTATPDMINPSSGVPSTNLSSIATSSSQQQSQQAASNLMAKQAQAAAADLVNTAAARFKMLRSNTLAAAFGISPEDPTYTTGSQSQTNTGSGRINDIVATRTKDDRVTHTLTTGAVIDSGPRGRMR